jgi:hypothetical protein
MIFSRMDESKLPNVRAWFQGKTHDAPMGSGAVCLDGQALLGKALT